MFNKIESGLEIKQLSFKHSSQKEIFEFDFQVSSGELVAILGPSGIGKSTLLSLIAGFETPLSGTICYNGQDLSSFPPAERPITSLFQEHNLFAHLTAEDNIGLGINSGLRLSSLDRQTIGKALNDVGLSGFNKRLPSELSGGQRQRVALARCLVRQRPILLLDEPFSALDQALRKEMLKLVKNLHCEHRLLTLMVTHLSDDADEIADRVIQLS
ncbi:thiamine ABC transporter ATP-binding protein [Kiloniella antarctica]|uniref:Thiamine ABC transporter ATP-binding protein n=1 Tax=Kiloniella antarctica TaxID=1550907 RepID=A0ABW5BHR7_9PROT